MRALVQRVSEASVSVEGKMVGSINSGFVVFLGISKKDTEIEAKYVVDKVSNLRIFDDDEGKFSYSPLDMGKEILVISQFTLYADVSKGRRPSFFESASPIDAEKIYNEIIEEFNKTGLNIKTGEFGAKMEINLVNDGPVTILLDSKL